MIYILYDMLVEVVADLPEHEAAKLKEKLEELNNMDNEVITFSYSIRLVLLYKACLTL